MDLHRTVPGNVQFVLLQKSGLNQHLLTHPKVRQSFLVAPCRSQGATLRCRLVVCPVSVAGPPPYPTFSLSLFYAFLDVSCSPECSNSVGEARRDTMLPSILVFVFLQRIWIHTGLFLAMFSQFQHHPGHWEQNLVNKTRVQNFVYSGGTRQRRARAPI